MSNWPAVLPTKTRLGLVGETRTKFALIAGPTEAQVVPLSSLRTRPIGSPAANTRDGAEVAIDSNCPATGWPPTDGSLLRFVPAHGAIGRAREVAGRVDERRTGERCDFRNQRRRHAGVGIDPTAGKRVVAEQAVLSAGQQLTTGIERYGVGVAAIRPAQIPGVGRFGCKRRSRKRNKRESQDRRKPANATHDVPLG